jgi:hemin uptake protein HemP
MPDTPTNATTPSQSPEASARAADTPVGVTNQARVCIDSAEILRGHKTVDITHLGSTYRLQTTRLGKLILTK